MIKHGWVNACKKFQSVKILAGKRNRSAPWNILSTHGFLLTRELMATRRQLHVEDRPGLILVINQKRIADQKPNFALIHFDLFAWKPA